MLREIYGTIKIEHKFNMSAKIDDYNNLKCYKQLLKIYKSLIKFRGYDDFVKAKNLSPCDTYIVDHDFIVELDENQHFSKARLISLKNYPNTLKTAFSINKWIQYCQKINASDPQPIYRDEQRAWYDTLRDFLPLIDGGFSPTMRIIIADYEWCSLNPKKLKDIDKFKSLIKG